METNELTIESANQYGRCSSNNNDDEMKPGLYRKMTMNKHGRMRENYHLQLLRRSFIQAKNHQWMLNLLDEMDDQRKIPEDYVN